MHHIVDLIVGLVGELGYIGIFIMMTVESSFVPFPSEVAMIPAGYLVALGEMNLYAVFFAGTLGALLGACINYGLGMYLGKPLVLKLIDNYGKYFLLSRKQYLSTERYFKNHGAITTFVGRFIPAVRQLISGPAGIFKMNFPLFLVLTFAGAGIWNAILIFVGYIAGQNDELIRTLLSNFFLGIVIVLGTIIGGYVYYIKLHKKEYIAIEEDIKHNRDEEIVKEAFTLKK